MIVKLWPGKSEAQKHKLADRIANDVMDVLGYGEESVSVAFEEMGCYARNRAAPEALAPSICAMESHIADIGREMLGGEVRVTPHLALAFPVRELL